MIRKSICFVTPYAHALFVADARGHGGAEVQQGLVGTALAERGWDVRFLGYAPGAAREETHQGIRFWTIPQPGDAAAGSLRTPPMAALWKGLKRVNADICYQRCAGSITGVVAAFARLHGRPFVFSVANDRDLDGRFIRDATIFQRALYRLGMRLATRVVVQTRYQADLLRERWGREGTLIDSACRLPEDVPPAAGRKGILWVGNLVPRKRPELVAKLAAALPGVPFTMIAPPEGDPSFVRDVLAAAARQPNVRHLERVPYKEMYSHYRSAALLVSTSSAEGFANVFLEAWANGMPVISFGIDPDGIIGRHGLGKCTGSLEETVAEVRRLLSDPAEVEAIGGRARSYIRENHSIEKVARQYEELFLGVLGISAGGGAESGGPARCGPKDGTRAP